MEKTDRILSSLIQIQKDTPQKIYLPENFQCQNERDDESSIDMFNFSEKAFNLIKKIKINNQEQLISWDADLVIFYSVYYDKNQKTQAFTVDCLREQDYRLIKNGSKRTLIGKIMFNLAHMISDENQTKDYHQSIMTSVHEILHLIAFDEKFVKNYQQQINPYKQPNLNNLLKFENLNKNQLGEAFENDHWNPLYLPFEVLMSYDNPYQQITIFTLELIDLSSNQFLTNKQNMEQSGQMFLENYFEYWNADCSDNKPSKNKFFCSKFDKNNQSKSCSSDYINKLKCSGKFHHSNCYFKQTFENSSCIYNTQGKQFESFGQNSRCFEVQEQNQASHYCFEIKSVSNQNIQFQIENEIYECNNEINFIEHNTMKINCPQISDFNKKFKSKRCEQDCNFNGICINGSCQCFKGYDKENNCERLIENGISNYFFHQTQQTLKELIAHQLNIKI